MSNEKENAIIINGVKYALEKPELEIEDEICDRCSLSEICNRFKGYYELCEEIFGEYSKGKVLIKQPQT